MKTNMTQEAFGISQEVTANQRRQEYIFQERKAESDKIISGNNGIVKAINKFFTNIGKVLANNTTPSQDFTPLDIKSLKTLYSEPNRCRFISSQGTRLT